nr:tautomerase family protein [Kitasatospora sp. Xyl93]
MHRALVDAVGIPADDRFQIITPHDPEELVFDPNYLDVARRDVVCVQITLVAGRPRELKLDLYRRLAANLTEVGVRPEDVFVTLTENALDDWSVGNGRAQLVELGAVAGAPVEP